MSGHTLLLTGVPRGGTTLACHLLGQSGDCVALFEPMDVMGLPVAPAAAVEMIDAFAQAARVQLLREGRAPSKQRDGTVPDNPFAGRDGSGRRQLQATPGELRLDAPPAPDFMLAIKHNAAFTALLPVLAEGRDLLAIVRNPLAVLASWQTVPLPVNDGRLPAGERFDASLATALDNEPDRIARQLLILDWFFGRFATSLPGERVLRYEDIVASGGERLFAAAAVSGTVVALEPRNASPIYRDLPVAALCERLCERDGTWSGWYSRDDLRSLAARMQSGD